MSRIVIARRWLDRPGDKGKTLRVMIRARTASHGYPRGLLPWVAVGLAVVSFGCIKVTTVNIGQKTSLERQLIGEFEPLTEEEILSSSVRAAAGSGNVALDDLHQRAVAARRRQLFNRDDVDELKQRGCLGELHDAQLAVRECEQAGAPDVAERLQRLVDEENADRAAIIDWALAADRILTAADRHQVVKLYARLIRERAAAGEWFRSDSGGWTQNRAAQ